MRQQFFRPPGPLSLTSMRSRAPRTRRACSCLSSICLVAIRYYLNGFAEHAPLGQWPLVAAVALALLAALAATARHTALAMRMSPVQALRS